MYITHLHYILLQDAVDGTADHQELAPLKEQEWYWGRRKMHDMKEKLRGTRDGAFLVCDSQYEGEYVLVVTKSGATELADISYVHHMYGFCDHSLRPVQPLITFPTVPALVEHFKRVPLKAVTKYNVYLDVTLAYPTSRFEVVSWQLYKVPTCVCVEQHFSFVMFCMLLLAS